MGKSLNEMLARYDDAVLKGDVKELNKLGNEFFELEDYGNAKKCCEAGVKLGDAESLCNLGYLYNLGLGVAKDCEKALCYYNKALDLGCLESLYWIGLLYVTGEIETDYDKANECFKRSIEEKRYVEECKDYINVISYVEGSTEVNYDLIFEDQIEIVNIDERSKIIYEMLKNGSQVVVYNSLKDLTLEILNNMPDDAIINIRTIKHAVDVNIYSDFYTVSELKMILIRINEILLDIDMNQNEEDIFMQIYLKLGDIIKPIKFDYHNIFDLGFYDSSFFNLMSLCSGISVCRGSALVLKNVLDIVGIECEILVSKGDEDFFNHTYSQVRINGMWYYCDLEWDKKYGIYYCLICERKFKDSDSHQTSHLTPEHVATEEYPNRMQLFDRNCLKVFGVDLLERVKMLESQYGQGEEMQKK